MSWNHTPFPFNTFFAKTLFLVAGLILVISQYWLPVFPFLDFWDWKAGGRQEKHISCLLALFQSSTISAPSFSISGFWGLDCWTDQKVGPYQKVGANQKMGPDWKWALTKRDQTKKKKALTESGPWPKVGPNLKWASNPSGPLTKIWPLTKSGQDQKWVLIKRRPKPKVDPLHKWVPTKSAGHKWALTERGP